MYTISFIYVNIHHIFFSHPSVAGCLGCFLVLALVNSATLGMSFLLEQLTLTKNILNAKHYVKPFMGFSDLILTTVL